MPSMHTMLSCRYVCATLYRHRGVLGPAVMSHIRDQLVTLVMLSDDLVDEVDYCSVPHLVPCQVENGPRLKAASRKLNVTSCRAMFREELQETWHLGFDFSVFCRVFDVVCSLLVQKLSRAGYVGTRVPRCFGGL
jgi:hypothetical protein